MTLNYVLCVKLKPLVFTVNLHLFAILLICRYMSVMSADSGIEVVDVRSALDHSLKVLQTFEKASLMSRKACNCISGFLRLFDTLGECLAERDLFVFPRY